MPSDALIILAAGKPHHGDKPSLLIEVNGHSLFDWQVRAFANSHGRPQVVIGFAAKKFKNLSKNVIFYKNEKWETSGSGYSLLSADLSGSSVLVSYADILYRPSIIKKLQASNMDVTFVFDSHWKQRFIGRTEDDLISSEKVIVKNGVLLGAGQGLPFAWANGEFIGLVRIQGKAMHCLQSMQNGDNSSLEAFSLSELIEWLRLQGCSTAAIDVQGDWAELNEPEDIAHFILGTKAETLDRLSTMVSDSIVLEQLSFTVSDWVSKSESILNTIKNKFGTQLLVVRSSAKSEDAFTHSNAGAYASVLNVNPEHALSDAITTVIDSYIECQPDDQVLIQPMVQDVRLSGVAFTRTLEHCAPFYIINYDESGSTESITSGCSKQHKSLYLRKDADISELSVDYLIPLVKAVKEVEHTLNYDALDIEFALDNQGKVYLLQVRPITAGERIDTRRSSMHTIELQSNAAKLWQTLQVPAPHIKGNKGLFGSMPDWNPAEIIGTNPGKLAVSLYEHLILNDVWAAQRAEYGYKDVRPLPLLRQFAGKPYIDIRASFNSFIPNEISDLLTEKLVNFYLDWLVKHPHLHDKIEFDVVPTCFGPMFSKWESRLNKYALVINEEEISKLKKGLLNITRKAFFRTSDDLAVLSELEKRHKQIYTSTSLPNSEKIRLLLDNCKIYGTLPFAHLARAGFVAVTLLREGVEANWLSVDARDGFMESLRSVSRELSEDAWHTAQGTKSWDSFVADYGHLRPGTYDITSAAYWDDPKRFLKPLVQLAQQPKPNSEKISTWHKEKAQFFNKVRSIGLEASDSAFEEFLIEAIEGREKSKFIFTRTLSAALGLITVEGKRFSLSTEELSNLSLHDLLNTFNSSLPIKNTSNHLKSISKKNNYERKISHACQLPPLLCRYEDFSYFVLTEEKPNYIGTSRITTQVVQINSFRQDDINVQGCIVLIAQADPGYDWLFGQGIAGLITMYGGANSHMAIRSAEFGLPAAIGVGKLLYKSFNSAQVIELDPAGETIRVIY